MNIRNIHDYLAERFGRRISSSAIAGFSHDTRNTGLIALSLLTAGGLVYTSQLSAAVTGAEFATAYTFIYDAATGFLGRAIAITGGLIGLGIGAARGSALPAIIGIILAIFGALGPDIIDAVFGSATV